jgi:DNA replicative helicase MCM subunit Mcm2 (Cdc46/Mcm family)
MGISKITVTLYTCERCQHKWIPRDATAAAEVLPTVCPKCKSPYWNRPRQDQASEQPKPAPKSPKKRAKKKP